MENTKEILEKLIFEDGLSYEKIGVLYGITGAGVKRRAKKFGIVLKERAKFSKDFIPHNKDKTKFKTIMCGNCGKSVTPSWSKQKYCSKECGWEHRKNETYKLYIENQGDYCGKIITTRPLKPHILKEQNNKCDICGLGDKWNDKLIVFILDHIDGDASNNMRENLRLVCPNCDSQLDTYKSKNKNSARKGRYLKNYKN